MRCLPHGNIVGSCRFPNDLNRFVTNTSRGQVHHALKGRITVSLTEHLEIGQRGTNFGSFKNADRHKFDKVIEIAAMLLQELGIEH